MNLVKGSEFVVFCDMMKKTEHDIGGKFHVQARLRSG
jgi:hypothetical protein